MKTGRWSCPRRWPLPHLFRILWLFWFLHDHMAEARPWVEQLLPAAASLDTQPRTELMWTALVTALDVGDDAAALAARERLVPLLEWIEDPFLRALCQLAMAWSSPLAGESGGFLQEVSVSLAQLRGQDEPFWTALAVGSLGWVEVGMGRYDDALRHLRDAYDLGDRFDSAWLAAWSRVQLGTLDIVQGRQDEARDLLDEALALSLAAHSTGSVTLCLVAFARYALMEGDAERAALLAGAAESLRRRVGLRAWPMLRHEEDDLVAQIRRALGAGRFDQVYAAGARLSQRDAVTAVRDRAGPGHTAAPSRPGPSSRSW
jgi:tetratricopeptide (TPR) repeat protein